ncbi:HD-GYP domain-containing protein [Clostridium akagii]|uniref:HD-GYP domain-containing protein n=1 Tax=Clostridium akagii TaxID=91623 RepID=UPI00047A895A|nr:HD-GYP domain-containing protein [Clostridium akagii]
MKINKSEMDVNDLEVGMVAANDIMCEGKILIAEGIPITERAIERLKQIYFYNKIQIYTDPDENEIKNDEMESLEQSFNELTGDLHMIFRGMENLQISGIDELRNFALRVKSELDPTSNVVKNIVLKGSGEDTIYRHGVNVSALSLILGRWLNLDDVQLNLLVYSAILHDFGKLKINQNILSKQGQLNKNDLKAIKSHPVLGYNYISKIPFLDKSVSNGILLHHEREDGSGYPFGLKSDKIPQFAKIIAIADVFDAINSKRAYREKKGPFEALQIIQKDELGKLDFEYCKVFINHVVNFYMGESVILNDGRVCKIIQVDPNDLQTPLLLDGSEFVDLKNRKDLYVKEMII